MARQFAALTQYHATFRSCNRAFIIDTSRRFDHWCGPCDKCCFIDLILAPFLPAADLERIFAGHEPLADSDMADTSSGDDGSLADKFRSLLGTTLPRANRSSAWVRSVNAGPRRCSPRSGPTGPAPSCSRCWPRS